MPRLSRVLPAALAALASLVGACSIERSEWFGPVPQVRDPRHFRWCNSGEPEWIDPIYSTAVTDLRVVYQLFDGLTTYDMEGQPIPSLAERWDVSADGRRYTFHLRGDARWTNGRALTADDFVWSWARALHPLSASPRADTLWKIVNAERYTTNTARQIVRAVGPFAAGDVVEVLPEPDLDDQGKPKLDKTGKPKTKAPPDSNLRLARAPIRLRLAPDAADPGHATLPTGSEVTIWELGGAARDWAWVHSLDGDGGMGWVPVAELDAPHAARTYRVRRIPAPFVPRPAVPSEPVEGEVTGADLLMTPAVLGFRAVDPRTFEVELERPIPYFMQLTTQSVTRPTPREAVARAPRKWTRPASIVSSGPFQLDFWRRRDRFELSVTPTFWGKDAMRIDRVTIYSLNDTSANTAYYYTGGCDALVSNNIPAAWRPVLSGDGPGQVKRRDYTRAPLLGIYFMIVNVEKVDNVHLRRALSAALDRRQLPEILKGGEVPTEQYTPGTPHASMTDAELALCKVTRDTPGVSMIVEPGKHCYTPPAGAPYDPELAKRELALARAELGDRFPKKLTYRFNTGVEFHKYVAEWAQAGWRDVLGLTVELESQEWGTYLASTRERLFEIARMGQIQTFPDPEGESLKNYRCGAADNRPGFCDPEFERLYAAAEGEPDRGKRLEYMRQAEQIFADAQAVIPLFVYSQHHLIRPYVKGLAINFVDQPTLRTVWLDPDWQKTDAAAAPAGEGGK